MYAFSAKSTIFLLIDKALFFSWFEYFSSFNMELRTLLQSFRLFIADLVNPADSLWVSFNFSWALFDFSVAKASLSVALVFASKAL